MRNDDLLRLNSFDRVAVLLLALVISTFTATAFAQTSAGSAASTAAPATTQAPPTEVLKNWRANMAQVPLPKEGCFTSSYPSTEWQQAPCTTAPAYPYPPASGPRANTVGNGNDVSAKVTGVMSEAIGSFDSVTGVTSETGLVGGAGGQVANTFSLQLNTEFFHNTPACNTAATPSSCQGWEQFVFSNGTTSSSGSAFIQYWLINYATTCPSGWNTAGTNCWKNGSNSINVPHQTIANLVNLSVTAQANTGGQDKIIMSVGNTLYSAQNPASILNLYQFWQEAEFNIVGDCCSSQANFNSGSTIVVRTTVNNGSKSGPSCDGHGFTGETNSLSFAPAPAGQSESLPAIVFKESSAGGAASACASATSVAGGGKVAHDFNGDGKSDVLWHNSNGSVAMWLMNGNTITSNVGVGSASTVWQIAGTSSQVASTGDFDGDGHADVVWRNTSTGAVAMWLLNGNHINSNVGAGSASLVWQIVGVGDFDGDGHADILWRNTSTGAMAMWLMNGNHINANVGLTGAGAGLVWQVAGIGDFNGDGKADIVWRNTSTGAVAMWLMNGNNVTSNVGVGSASTDWQIVGVGDFDGDGHADLLWRNSSTAGMAMWLLNGSHINGNVTVTGAGAGSVWEVASTGDYNSDGKADILWRNTSTGAVAMWLMNGASVTSNVGAGSAATAWTIVE